MKKLLYTLFLICTAFISACETNNVSKIRKEVKIIGKCCKELSGDHDDTGRVQKEEKKAPEPSHNVSSILPAYFWDTKCMIW